jgi:hypothetical protein
MITPWEILSVDWWEALETQRFMICSNTAIFEIMVDILLKGIIFSIS